MTEPSSDAPLVTSMVVQADAGIKYIRFKMSAVRITFFIVMTPFLLRVIILPSPQLYSAGPQTCITTAQGSIQFLIS